MRIQSLSTRLLACAATLLALAPGQVRARAAGATSSYGQPVASSGASTAPIEVKFDGQIVTSNSIGALANDPVIAWGPVRDDRGLTVPGQIWLVVGKNSKAIFYQLSEAHASGKGAYSGYAVQTKAVQTQTLVNFGQGADVPAIGNDEDGFVVSTTELFVRKELIGGYMTVESMSTQAPTSDPLLRVGTIVLVANTPHATSAERLVGSQIFDANGTLLDDRSTGIVPSGGSLGCEAFGDGVGDLTEAWLEEVSDLAKAMELSGTATNISFAQGNALGGVVGSISGGVRAGYLSRDMLFPLTEGMESIQKSMWVPLASALAEDNCNRQQLGVDLFGALVDIGLQMVESTCSMTSICTGYEDTLDSTSANGTTLDDQGNTIELVDVTGHVGSECVESDVVVVCEEW